MPSKNVQGRPISSRFLSTCLHSVGLLSFAASFKYLIDYPNIINESYGWHMQFLTIIALSIASLTFAAGLISDLSGSQRVDDIKYRLSLASAPLETLVSFLYWGLRLIDRKLVMPDWMELSPIADVGFHAVPTILLVADLLLFSRSWKVSVSQAFLLSSALACAYWIWIENCYKHNKYYPYPLFELLSPPYRALLFAVSSSLMTGSSMLLKSSQSYVQNHWSYSGVSK